MERSLRAQALSVPGRMETPFSTDLSTEYKPPIEANAERDLVVLVTKEEVDEGKTEKKGPESIKKSSTEISESSKPKTSTEAPPSGQVIVTVESSSSHQDEAEKLQLEQSLHIIIMITKKDFKNNGHEKSGRYYLPECPPYNKEGCKSRPVC